MSSFVSRFSQLQTLAAIALLLAGSATAQMCGDCDCDGDIDIVDALRASQFSAGIGSPAPVQTVKCDVNDSMSLSVVDALFIAQWSAGLVVPLMCPGTGNAPPVADLCTNTATMGDIPVTYVLSDAELDTCSILVEWSSNHGTTFGGVCTEAAVGSDGVSGLASSVAGIGHTFVWNSIADFGAVNQPGLVIRITPSDMQAGFSCRTMPFTLGNAPGTVPPTATGCTATVSLCGGLVSVDYLLVDPDSAQVDIVAEYSTNGGASFAVTPPTQCPGSDGLTALTASPAGAPHVFVWDSAMDLAPVLHNNVVVRITPSDPAAGTRCSTAPFSIDLSPAPSRPGDGGTYGAATVGVVDVWAIDAQSGVGIPGASVMIGLVAGSPFAGNVGTTDAMGHIRFCDATLAGPNVITAGAPNRQYVTFYNTSASQVVCALRLVDSFPATTAVSGAMTGVTLPSCAGFTPNLGAGISIPVVRADNLLSGFFGFVIGPDDCWQSGSGLVGNLALPGNVFIPAQTIAPLCSVSVNRHSFTLDLEAGSNQQLTGLFGQLDAAAAAGATTAADLINGFDLREFCTTTSFLVTGGPTQTRDIPKTGALTGNVTMTVGNSPTGMDVFGVTAADLTGGNGAGPLAVLGARIATYTALGSGPVNLTLTTTPPAALGGTAGYLGLAAALFIDNLAPPAGLENALSAILKRDGGITASGGSVTLNTFLGAPSLSAPGTFAGGVYAFSDPSIAPPDLVDVVLHRFQRFVEDPATSLAPCPGTTMKTRSSIYWEFFTMGGATSFTMPTLPASFPRQATNNGLFDPAATMETDSIEWNAAFVGMGGTGLPSAPAFDFNSFQVADFSLWVTHLAANFTTL